MLLEWCYANLLFYVQVSVMLSVQLIALHLANHRDLAYLRFELFFQISLTHYYLEIKVWKCKVQPWCNLKQIHQQDNYSFYCQVHFLGLCTTWLTRTLWKVLDILFLLPVQSHLILLLFCLKLAHFPVWCLCGKSHGYERSPKQLRFIVLYVVSPHEKMDHHLAFAFASFCTSPYLIIRTPCIKRHQIAEFRSKIQYLGVWIQSLLLLLHFASLLPKM